MRQIIGLSLGLVLLVGGCDGNDGNVPEAGPPPISGGTLHVTADARYARCISTQVPLSERVRTACEVMP